VRRSEIIASETVLGWPVNVMVVGDEMGEFCARWRCGPVPARQSSGGAAVLIVCREGWQWQAAGYLVLREMERTR